MLPHMLPKPHSVERSFVGPTAAKEACSFSGATGGRYIQVRERMPGPRIAATVEDATTEEMISEEWSSLVDEHLMESPRSAHMRLREIRQSAKMHQAWQKEVFREMQAKLERYERDQPSPRLQKSRVEEAPLQPEKPPPFSQKQQREILQEFQRQQEEKLEQLRQIQEERMHQERQQARQSRRSSRRKSQEAPRTTAPSATSAPSKRKPASLGRMFGFIRAKMSLLLGRGQDVVTAYEGANAASVQVQAASLMQQMEETLAATRHEPAAVRRKVFRDLQRKLHPDKNSDCKDAAKLAFQQLMDQQTKYLQ